MLGWPTLDQPLTPGGEGLGWRNHLDGAEYQALHVTIPRLGDHRKTAYQASAARYAASGGQLMAVDDVTGEVVHAIGPAEARMLRAAAVMVHGTPVAQMEPIGLGFVNLEPGDRAILPLRWNVKGAERVTNCSTHPDAPTGLAVMPGTCDAGEHMSVVVENESPLSITIAETDMIAIGVEEGTLPSLDAYAIIPAKQEKFGQSLDWSGAGKDSQKEIQSQPNGATIVVCLLYTSPSPRDRG